MDGAGSRGRLPMNHFDIVHAKNAIDHSYNAPQVLREMVRPSVHTSRCFGIAT
jgi:hypothetical protein